MGNDGMGQWAMQEVTETERWVSWGPRGEWKWEMEKERPRRPNEPAPGKSVKETSIGANMASKRATSGMCRTARTWAAGKTVTHVSNRQPDF